MAVLSVPAQHTSVPNMYVCVLVYACTKSVHALPIKFNGMTIIGFFNHSYKNCCGGFFVHTVTSIVH